MVQVLKKVREVGMSVIRSTRSLEEVLSVVEDGNDVAVMTVISYTIREDQKRLIEELSKRNGESQATVLRAIIDEWVEQKLRDGRP